MSATCGQVGSRTHRVLQPRRSNRRGVTIAVVATGMALGGVVLGPASVRASAAPHATPSLAGTWQALPTAPIVPADPRLVSVWTGREMLLFDRVASTLPDVAARNAAVAYNPASRTWRVLTPPERPGGNYEGSYVGAWTGREMLVGGPLTNFAYNPTTNRWRALRAALGGPMAVWTGREMISWGGGCCGDASAEGLAYNPATNKARKLPASPLAASQRPIGVWTGREVVILISGFDPNGKPYPTSFARAAAFNPTTNRWRRIPKLPVAFGNPQAVWDGHCMLVTAAGTTGRTTLSFNPTTNRWRTRAAMPSRLGAVPTATRPIVWTGTRLMLWRGRDGLAYNPRTNRWTALSQWPSASHADAVTMVWTGRRLIVWGFTTGSTPSPGEGAAFTPAVP